MEFIQTKDEISNNVNANLGIACGFGLIFKKEHIELFENGIWNIHFGKLPDIRSRHPIPWAFMLNHQEFWVSLHEINSEIDRGYLLAQKKVFRDLNDTHIDIERKFEEVIEELLIEGETNFINGNKTFLEEGTYYRNLSGEFKDINPLEYDAVFIFNLSKSLAKYGGFVILGKKYNECVFFNEEFPDFYDGYDLYKCKDNKIIAVK